MARESDSSSAVASDGRTPLKEQNPETLQRLRYRANASVPPSSPHSQVLYMKRLFAATTLLAALQPALAFDAACEPILNASEAKLAQPAWHSVVETSGAKLEYLKLDGNFFMNVDGEWQKSPMNLDEAEKIAIRMIQDGSLKVSDCKDLGTDTIDGLDVTVLSYRSDAGDSSSGTVKLYIGKNDGLPYKSATDDGKTTASIRYTNVSAPKL